MSFSSLRKSNDASSELASGVKNDNQVDLAHPFQDFVAGSLFQIRPVKRTHKLHLAWQLPPLVAKYRTKPYSVISHLLGHEGDGSILAYLKKQGFATEIYAGVESSGFETNTLGSLFITEIQLTLKGLANWPEVVEAVFSVRAMGCGTRCSDVLTCSLRCC